MEIFEYMINLYEKYKYIEDEDELKTKMYSIIYDRYNNKCKSRLPSYVRREVHRMVVSLCNMMKRYYKLKIYSIYDRNIFFVGYSKWKEYIEVMESIDIVNKEIVNFITEGIIVYDVVLYEYMEKIYIESDKDLKYSIYSFERGVREYFDVRLNSLEECAKIIKYGYGNGNIDGIKLDLFIYPRT